MNEKVKAFNEYPSQMNERILAEDNRIIKRMFSVDSLAYSSPGGLSRETRELLGLVASLVLRCDDCVKYHLGEKRAARACRAAR